MLYNNCQTEVLRVGGKKAEWSGVIRKDHWEERALKVRQNSLRRRLEQSPAVGKMGCLGD